MAPVAGLSRIPTVIRLDDPDCALTEETLQREWTEAELLEEARDIQIFTTTSNTDYGKYLHAHECCWKIQARMMGWQRIDGTDKYGPLCALGLRPLPPYAYETRRRNARTLWRDKSYERGTSP